MMKRLTSSYLELNNCSWSEVCHYSRFFPLFVFLPFVFYHLLVVFHLFTAMATLTSSFTNDVGVLSLETIATGVAPNIAFTYPIARVTEGSIGFEYCQSVSTVDGVAQPIPVTPDIIVNSEHVTVITGKINSVGQAPVNVICKLTVSSGAKITPTIEEYISQHGSLLLDGVGTDTVIHPAKINSYAMRSILTVGSQPGDRNVHLKIEDFRISPILSVIIYFGKYVSVHSSYKKIQCMISRGNNTIRSAENEILMMALLKTQARQAMDPRQTRVLLIQPVVSQPTNPPTKRLRLPLLGLFPPVLRLLV